MNRNATNGFMFGKLSLWVVVKLPAGDDVRVHPGAGEMEHEVAEELAGRRMIREKVSIEDNETRHQLLPRLRPDGSCSFGTAGTRVVAGVFAGSGGGNSSSIFPANR